MLKKLFTIAVAVVAVLTLVLSSTTLGMDTKSVSVTATSSSKVILELVAPASGTVSFGNVNLDTANETISAVSIRVKSNELWTLKVKATNFTGATTGTTIPASNLEWRTGANPYVALSNLDYTITSNHSRGVTNYAFDYRLNIGYDYPPDNYTSTVTYTLTP
ncbi:MAG: hypothetical protein M1548_07575 [Actinobacteria bacterium]|nr:hypothetical protein [Actinomycetota bacterium]